MPDDYTLKEVQVVLSTGATVTASIGSIAGLRKLLTDLRSVGFVATSIRSDQQPDTSTAKQRPTAITARDTPDSRVEIRAGLSAGSLVGLSILAFKDDIPELLKPTSVSVTDAVLLLLFALEVGLKRQQIDFESFKDLYDAQNIKSGSPLSMKLTDLRNGGYIDKSVYANKRSLRLTAKGEKKAVQILKAANQ